MAEDGKILVVGTTPDYIDLIRRARPGEVLFLTDPRLRRYAREPRPEESEEVLVPLNNYNRVGIKLQEHLRDHAQFLLGVACYECESLALAATLAYLWGLPYVSRAAVGLCRDKFQAKQRWREEGVPSPRFSLASSAEEAQEFLEGRFPGVIKPLDGSGSELVFRVSDLDSCREAFRYNKGQVLVEEMVQGEEYSCDFAVLDGVANILRFTRKYSRPGLPFGTVEAYELLPLSLVPDGLEELCLKAAQALGIERSICMLDFIIDRSGIKLLELAPRPGGSCLPFLLRIATGQDLTMRVLDWAVGRFDLSPLEVSVPLVGSVLYASGAGIIDQLDDSSLRVDPRFRALEMRRRLGDEISLPPNDYDSWQLAYLVYHPKAGSSVPEQNRELARLFRPTVEGL